jgi:DNA-directed RNA polymerase subunit E'/Rpb7
MEHIAIFEEQVSLTPRDLRGEITSIDAILEEKLRSRLEGRCSRHGYVRQGTLKLLSRSMGKVERGRFTGNVLFHAQAEAKVLNPPDGAVLTGEVIRKNKMGLYVNYEDAIRIIIPRDLNIGNDEFETVDVGEMITVELKKSRFQVNDEYILSVGLFQGRKEPRVAPAAAPAEELDEEGVTTLEDDGEAKEADGVDAETISAAESEEEEGKETE